ncbi:MAG: hypothetical protein ABEN55_03810 [Bradymonadaceae bacterium]
MTTKMGLIFVQAQLAPWFEGCQWSFEDPDDGPPFLLFQKGDSRVEIAQLEDGRWKVWVGLQEWAVSKYTHLAHDFDGYVYEIGIASDPLRATQRALGRAQLPAKAWGFD